jgi:Ca2+-binding EF-hand superfamily protein
VGNLTEDQLIDIREVFNHFDTSGDNALQFAEFMLACKGVGLAVSEEDCQTFFDGLDSDGDNSLSFQEFSKFCADQLESGVSKDDVLRAWQTLSSSGSGKVSVDKLKDIFKDDVYVSYMTAQAKPSGEEGDEGLYLDYIDFTEMIFQR